MTVQIIPLAKLRKAPENARAHTKREVEGFAASIREVGLIHPLSAYQDGEWFNVDDGGGRLDALNDLRKAKKLPAALREGVPVVVQESAALARLRSVAANEVREEMGSADTILAYRAMVAEGHDEASIARACNVGAARVRRLLRLINVADPILQAHKAGVIDLDVVAAFSITNDQGAQLAVFEALGGAQMAAYAVKERLKASTVQGASALAKFIGVEAYEAAGGRRLIDLFTHNEDAGWLDGDLARRLADEKLAAAAEAVKAEGWGEVIVTDDPHGFARDFFVLDPTPYQLTDEEAAAYDDASLTLEDEDATDDAVDAAEAVVAALDAKQLQWTPEAMADGVAFVMIASWSGALRIERGFARKRVAKIDAADLDGGAAREPEDKPQGDAALEGWGHGGHAELTQIATASVRCALLAKPDDALDVLLAHMGVQVVHRYHTASAITYTAGHAFPVKGERLNGAEDLFDAVLDKWAKRLPKDFAQAIPVVAALKAKEKAELAALCVGGALDATEAGLHHYQRSASRWASLGVIARHIGHKITDHWSPSAAWLARGSKAALIDGLRAVGVTRFTTADKRDAMAAALEREAKAKGWLPKLLADLTPPPVADADEAAPPQAMAAE